MEAADLSRLNRAQKIEAIALLEERRRRLGQRVFFHLFPDEDTPWAGPAILKKLIVPGQMLYARRRYAKHLEFFKAGATFSERCFMAANRVGKTLSGGGFETACHLTGLYPDWWEGRRFDHAISAWAAGKKNETTRDIVQATLLGEIAYRDGRKTVDGCGVIPGHLIGQPSWKQGVQDLVDTVRIRHVSGEWSILGLKSYEQGRGGFEGTGQHVIWFDEEPPADVYSEALTRTTTTNGIIMLTFTPLEGQSQVVLSFMPADQRPEL